MIFFFFTTSNPSRKYYTGATQRVPLFALVSLSLCDRRQVPVALTMLFDFIIIFFLFLLLSSEGGVIRGGQLIRDCDW